MLTADSPQEHMTNNSWNSTVHILPRLLTDCVYFISDPLHANHCLVQQMLGHNVRDYWMYHSVHILHQHFGLMIFIFRLYFL